MDFKLTLKIARKFQTLTHARNPATTIKIFVHFLNMGYDLQLFEKIPITDHEYYKYIYKIPLEKWDLFEQYIDYQYREDTSFSTLLLRLKEIFPTYTLTGEDKERYLTQYFLVDIKRLVFAGKINKTIDHMSIAQDNIPIYYATIKYLISRGCKLILNKLALQIQETLKEHCPSKLIEAFNKPPNGPLWLHNLKLVCEKEQELGWA